MGGTKGGSRGPKDQGKRPVGPSQPVIQLNLNTNVELNKAENAWKPQAKKEGSAEVEEDPCAELERNVRSILNKLTPQKFDKLVTQFNGLKIDSEKKLANSIELIFEKVSTFNLSLEIVLIFCHKLTRFGWYFSQEIT